MILLKHKLSYKNKMKVGLLSFRRATFQRDKREERKLGIGWGRIV